MAKKAPKGVDEAIALLESKLSGKTPIEIASFKFERAVKISELALVEKSLKRRLPEDYKNFISKRGLFVATGDQGKDFFRMLSPAESLKRIKKEIKEFDETCFGENPEDMRRARRENEVRRNLYPLQYIGHHAADFFSYFLPLKKSPILDIRHDDFELADWLLAPKPKFAKGAFAENFDRHFIRVIGQCITGKYGD